MLRPQLLLLLLLLPGAASHATAQTIGQATSLTGRVLDAKTNLPVQYASLSLLTEHDWTLANPMGHFELFTPKILANDTLLVACPGYQPRRVVLRNRTLPDTTLTLEKTATTPKIQPLNAAPAVVRRLGSVAKRPGDGMIQGTMGSQFALFMEPSLKHRLGSIRNVSFFIGENGFPKESFRIRLYRADGPNHSPGTNLLSENLIVAAPGGGQWFTVDLSKFVVEVPREGFFVAMEWIINHKFPGLQDGYPALGQVLRPTSEFKDSKTWTLAIGMGWNLLTIRNQESRAYNAMIRAEIEELD